MQPERREFLRRGATALTALAVAAYAGVERAYAQQKTLKAQAGYQPRPNGSQRCGNCANFLPDGGCRVVEGAVSPNGWSRLYQPRRG
jgi:hypothetical protein